MTSSALLLLQSTMVTSCSSWMSSGSFFCPHGLLAFCRKPTLGRRRSPFKLLNSMWPCPLWIDFWISVEVVRVLQKYQLILEVMMRLSSSVVVFSCSGCGVLIGVDSLLSGFVQPVQDLLGRFGSFHPDRVASRVKRGLASFHSMC